jgi:DUF1365 family protein
MTMSSDAACVYSGSVMHQRLRDRQYRFQYRVFSLLLDIDRLDEAMAVSPLLSRNRFNLLGFYDRDHLPAGATDLRAWAEGVLSPAGIDASRLRIRLLCMPRVLGMVFNPLSLWYCEDPDGRPVAVIAEVRNTFGERHCYLLRPAPGAHAWPLRAEHAKDFHVSPFIGMQASYRFRLERPGQRLRIAIREYAEDELLLVATQHGVRRPLRSRVLLAELLRVPLQTVKVLTAIHWQALKIWLAGVRFHQKPSPPLEEIS